MDRQTDARPFHRSCYAVSIIRFPKSLASLSYCKQTRATLKSASCVVRKGELDDRWETSDGRRSNYNPCDGRRCAVANFFILSPESVQSPSGKKYTRISFQHNAGKVEGSPCTKTRSIRSAFSTILRLVTDGWTDRRHRVIANTALAYRRTSKLHAR